MAEEPIAPPKIRRRTDVDLVVEILAHLKREPSRKQHVMMDCRLAHKVVTKYLDKLVKGGHIIEHLQPQGRSTRFYTISEPGNQLLLKLQESNTLVQEVLA